MTLAQSVFSANSFEIAEVWLARGFDQWKSGSPDEGERSMSEAVRMLRNRTDVPPKVLAISQLLRPSGGTPPVSKQTITRPRLCN
jgi:hypothetical protein